jgi:hypothetical protein
MFDDPAAMFYENVASAYQTYVDQRNSNTSGRHQHLRNALEAAAALFHFREHLPGQHAMTWREVYAACPDYRLIAAVSNAFKHHSLTRNDPEGFPLVKSVDALEEVCVVTQYRDNEGNYVDVRTITFVNCTDGIRRNLDDALTNVLNFWGTRLQDLGIIGYKLQPLPEIPGSRFIPRPEARGPNFEITQRIRFRQNLQFLEFDEALGKATPIDLTDKEVRFSIYKATHMLKLSFDFPNGRGPITLSLDLTDEEAQALLALGTEDERTAFVKSLASARQDDIQQKLSQAMMSRGQ